MNMVLVVVVVVRTFDLILLERQPRIPTKRVEVTLL